MIANSDMDGMAAASAMVLAELGVHSEQFESNSDRDVAQVKSP